MVLFSVLLFSTLSSATTIDEEYEMVGHAVSVNAVEGVEFSFDDLQKVKATHVGLASSRKGTGERVFVFSPRELQWAAYDEDGYRVASGKANGGKSYCPDVGRSCKTPVGVFRVLSKRGAGCTSSKYPVGKGGAPMPYCMYFHKAGYAIHGSPHISNKHGSHGCIRVTTDAAKWLHKYFIKPGTKVIVHSY